MIKSLQNAIKNNPLEVFNSNPDLWKTLKDINGNEIIDDYDDFIDFFKTDNFLKSSLINSFKTTD